MKSIITICFLFLSISCIGQNFILNGDFSTTNYAWTKTGYFQYDSRFTNYKSAPAYAYLADFAGQKANNISGQLYQDFFLPNGNSSIEISFWYRITTDESVLAGANDTCSVYFVDPSTGGQLLLAKLSNQYSNTVYNQLKFKLTGITTGKNWRVLFSAGTNNTSPTVFRIDDVAVQPTVPYNMNCIAWTNNRKPLAFVDTAMEKLCTYGVINSSQDTNSLNNLIPKLEVAQALSKAVLYLNGNPDISFLDNFPNIFPELNSLSTSDQRYMKMMLYLEYKDRIAPAFGTDNIAPFSRDYFFQAYNGSIKKSDAVKAALEALNVDMAIAMANYDATSSSYSPTICDFLKSNKNLGWAEKARSLGLMDNITTPCGTNAIIFNETSGITYRDFYVILGRLMDKITTPSLGYDDFFIPNLYFFTSLNNTVGDEKGVFHDYSNGGFHIPGGGLPLDFQISYHSNLTEIPFLNTVGTGMEDSFLRPKLQPLGGGWTHNYNAFIKSMDINGNKPDRILIYWPDGTIHSYSVLNSKYETKGITDKLSIDSFNNLNQPSRVTITRGRTTYLFRNIDPLGYAVLALVSVTDAYNNSLILDYADGVATFSNWRPKLLTKVTDNYSGRFLSFNYWPGTNYLKEVVDPLSRTLTFYANKYTHDLDSSLDAKGQKTRYSYLESVGTFAYRTHLLTSIKRPKGNTITNYFYERKIKQSQSGNYVKQIAAVPDYSKSWSNQQSAVTVIKNGQTFNTNYIFDSQGNSTNASTGTDNIQRIFDSENRLIIERDLNKGFVTKLSYDANGFLSRRVLLDSLFNDSARYDYVNNQYGEVTKITDNNEYYSGPVETKIYKNSKGKDSVVVTSEGTGGEIRHVYSYNSKGLLIGYIDPTQHQFGLSYNSYGNVSMLEAYPFPFTSTNTQTFAYDNISRLIRYTNANGDSTTYNYDNNDNLTSSTIDPAGLGLQTRYSYDANDNVTAIQSPKGHTTNLFYDFYTDDLLEENDGTDKKRWRYNTDGTLDTFINKNNVVFKQTYYDSATFANTPVPGYLYSDGYTFRQYKSKSKVLYRIIHNGKENTLWYGAEERGKWNKPSLVSSQNYFSGPLDNISYTYDRYGRLTNLAYPSYGSNTYGFDYFYDPINKKLSSIYKSSSSTKYVEYDYQKDGTPLMTRYGNGDTIFYHYDAFNRLDSVWATNKTGQLLYSIGATLDKTGKHTRENLQIIYNGKIDSTIPTSVLGIKSYNYQTRNRILTGDGKTYSNTNAGDIDSFYSPSVKCTWTEYSQLASIKRGSITTNYEYDPLGNRKRKDNTYYVVDQENTGNVLMEATQSTSPISVYLWGSDNGLVARINPINDSTYYYHFDFRGDVIAITNQNGQLVQFYKYDEYGKAYVKGGSLTWSNPYQYVGKWGVQADDSDLYYMKARYYQPSTGRFFSEDPIWNTNLFVYAGDDPVNNIDPNGEQVNTKEILKKSINASLQSLKKSFSNIDNYKVALQYALLFADEGLPVTKGLPVNQASTAILKNGYVEVNGFKFTEYYYSKLWNSGRGAPSLVAKEVLQNSKNILQDKMPGFFQYEFGNWKMVYNPSTKEVQHLLFK